jgi:hypothetical protein
MRLVVIAAVENVPLHVALVAPPPLGAATTLPARMIAETAIVMTAEIVTETTMIAADPAALPTVTATGIVT